MNSEERRGVILELLRQAEGPVSATVLAGRLSVSRQIIVGDVALLRAAGENIVATPRGYVSGRLPGQRYTVACRHTSEEMERELTLMVDCGCTVEDVIVDHSLYGQLTGQLNLSSRQDVEEFLRRAGEAGVKPLSDLTGGIHLHTLRCPSRQALDRLLEALGQAGFLLE